MLAPLELVEADGLTVLVLLASHRDIMEGLFLTIVVAVELVVC